MDVFQVHQQLLADYEAFTSGFTKIHDLRIRHVEQRLANGDQWPRGDLGHDDQRGQRGRPASRRGHGGHPAVRHARGRGACDRRDVAARHHGGS